MIELRDLVLQLRKGESIKSMHRSSGRHKSVIRALKALAEQQGWLASTSSVPTEAEVQAVWATRLSDPATEVHPLDALSEDFQRWLSEGTSFVVMHKLATERVPCSEATVRRYLHRRFPQLPIAAVIKASWEDPLVNRAYRSLAEHYGFCISPCLPATPEHKGGVESYVKYAKRNYWPCLKDREHRIGHEVPRLAEAVRYLAEWNDTVCETRMIAKVGHTVPELFAIESQALLPLPPARWDPLGCAMAKVSVDWRIQFQKAFYSVPYRYIGERVLITATRHPADRRAFESHTSLAVCRESRTWTARGRSLSRHLFEGARAGCLWHGDACGLMADAILSNRAVDGIRPLRALVGLKNRYPVAAIDEVCARLLSYGAVGYTSVKNELAHDQKLACVPPPAFRFARQATYYGEVLHG